MDYTDKEEVLDVIEYAGVVYNVCFEQALIYFKPADHSDEHQTDLGAL